MRIAILMLLLTAWARPTVAPLLVPVSAEDALPRDIDRSEVNRDPDDCYFYTHASESFVVKDRDGNPICIPT